ncbi:hypothetical protein [Undibacterium parvum]|uniref:DUF4410 domain-containing protein n=1 Tax=Undibacterium parvum TaxID=401471 RepID=A0A3Q9BS69_9BURK|nr:hypothetical protein [Undibacterium parvum]AZP13055.1 hypothetical protein EJN92_14230 [Undibacterium parvum]
MKKSIRFISLASCLLALSLTQGCATKVKASTASNPAPSEAFSAYGRINLKPATFKQGYKGSAAGLAKIEENLAKDLAPSLETWNKTAANGRTLTIEPIVEELEFTRGATRVFLGPLAGSSGVLMRIKITDAQGKIVATPEFFQRADAMAAGFLFGVHDNLMLTRVANLASAYVINNYGRAQGGPTGADDKALAAK